jgi:predicted MFS family arabinose efflux permease
MTFDEPAPGSEPSRRLFLPSLAIAAFSVGVSNAIITLFAVDIARTFFGTVNAAAVGAVSQLSTVNAAAEIVFALLLSILAIRFRQKPLLLIGVTLVVISAIGSFFAPTLLSLQFFLAMEGGGSIMVSVMAFTLVGDILPADKKAKAISYIVSVGALSTLATILLFGFITNVGGWRYDFLFVALPVSAAGLALATFFLPSKPREKSAVSKENPYSGSFRQIFTNGSATACLISNILTIAGTQVAVFAIAFYRTVFAVPREWTVGIFEVAAVIYTVAPLVSGRFVSKFGAKRVAVLSAFLAAFFTIAFFFIPNLWLAFTFDMLHVWFAAFSTPAFVYLILEQVPKSRGTMLSLNSIFNNIGNVIAPALGGTLLFITSGLYGVVGLALGSITVVGSAVLLFLAKDTTKASASLQKQR